MRFGPQKSTTGTSRNTWPDFCSNGYHLPNCTLRFDRPAVPRTLCFLLSQSAKFVVSVFFFFRLLRRFSAKQSRERTLLSKTFPDILHCHGCGADNCLLPFAQLFAQTFPGKTYPSTPPAKTSAWAESVSAIDSSL